MMLLLAELQLSTLFEWITVNIQHKETGSQVAFGNLHETVTQKHYNDNNYI